MGSSSPYLQYIVASLAFVASALASATSAGIAALGEHRAAGILEDEGDEAPAGLGTVVARPDAVRLALICLDTAGKLTLGAIAFATVRDLALPPALEVLAFAGAGVVFLAALAAVRALAARDPERNLAWVAPVAAIVELLTRPLAAPLTALARAVRGPFAPSTHGTAEELEYLIEKGAKSGAIEESHRNLLESVMEFSEVRVREIMVPRPKVVALPADAPYDEVVKVVIDSGHSRLPVFEESVDNVIGVLYAKSLLDDLAKAPVSRRFKLADRVSTPFFVPETMKISHLLTEFQRRGLQMAVVVDEFGGTSGVVTLEDVVEEIVGEIRDEGDVEEIEPIRQIGEGVFLAEGDVSIREVEAFLEEALGGVRDFEFPEEGDYDTVGGFVTAMAGRVPRMGEQVRHDGLIFTVRSANEKRVARVEITLVREKPPRAEEAEESSEAEQGGGTIVPTAAAREQTESIGMLGFAFRRS